MLFASFTFTRNEFPKKYFAKTEATKHDFHTNLAQSIHCPWCPQRCQSWRNGVQWHCAAQPLAWIRTYLMLELFWESFFHPCVCHQKHPLPHLLTNKSEKKKNKYVLPVAQWYQGQIYLLLLVQFLLTSSIIMGVSASKPIVDMGFIYM